jgi:peptide/nickel transport system permease protein
VVFEIRNPYARYVLRKGVFYAGLWFAAVFLNFLLPRIMPGDPIRLWLENLLSISGQFGASGGIPASLEGAERYYDHYVRMFALDRSPYEQFIPWLVNFLKGDWGVSLAFWPRPVIELVATHMVYSLAILVPSLIVSWLVGNYLGAYIAFKGGKADKLGLASLQWLALTPAYWLIIVLTFIFGFWLGWLPLTGRPYYVVPSLSLDFIVIQLKHWILPFTTITLIGIGGWSIGMRAYVIYQLNSNYARYSKALGLPDRVVARYAFRNAIIPQFTAFAINFGGLFAGNLLVEATFGYPGMGALLASLIGRLDIFAMQALFTFTATMLIIANFIADALYGFIDPRIRRGIMEVVTR